MKTDAIIIGGGIAGLATAYYLVKNGKSVTLLETAATVGGVIQTHTSNGFLLERGPNSFRGTHEILDLVEDLALSNQLVTADPQAPAYVYLRGNLLAVPMGIAAFLRTPLLSLRAKLRILKEPFIAKQISSAEESVASFVRRRLGVEILDHLVAPFLSGVYAGDPEQLSIQAIFAKLPEFEQRDGSILRGAMHAARTARPAAPKRSLKNYRLCSFHAGLQTFTDELFARLRPQIKTSVSDISIKPGDALRYTVSFLDDKTLHTDETDNLIIATPAYVAADLLQSLAPQISQALSRIPYTSLVAVPLAYRKEQIQHHLQGFGFLAPRTQGIRTLGSIWNSSLFPNRVPDGYVLLNNFIGGATDINAIELGDEQLIQIVHHDLTKVLDIRGEPIALPLTRWKKAIPQYNLGHAQNLQLLENELRQQPGLALTGNYLTGVALGECIKRGLEIASMIK